MKLVIFLIICFILAMIVTAPLFSFAWFMAQRTFMAILIAFIIGFILGKWKS